MSEHHLLVRETILLLSCSSFASLVFSAPLMMCLFFSFTQMLPIASVFDTTRSSCDDLPFHYLKVDGDIQAFHTLGDCLGDC